MIFGNKMSAIEKATAKGKEGELIKLSMDKDKAVRLAAIAGLGKCGKDDGFNALVPMLHNIDPELRSAAATALGEMGNVHAKAHLAFQLNNEKDANVQAALRAAMKNIADY